MLDELRYSTQSMIDSLIMGIPDVIKALLLLLLAWGVAVIAKAIFQKVFVKVGVGHLLSKTPLVKDEAGADKILENIGKLVYFLVFILFLPAVFGAINMTEVSDPIANMVSQFLNYIPNVIAAAIIITIGIFVAKLVRELFKQFFSTLNLDKWFQRINPDKENHAATQITLSTVIANVIYILILIPFITIGLEALGIASISNPIQAVLQDVLAIIPNIFVAVILIIVGYYIGKFLGNLLSNLLLGVGISQIFKPLGLSGETNTAKINIPKILGSVVQILVLLFFTVEALNVINLNILNTIGQAIIYYLPFLLSALIILAAGLFFANLLGNWIKRNTNSPMSAMLIKGVIITFAIFMALDQLHFATSIVNTAFLLILGGLMVAFALAFGLGGKEFAKNRLEKFRQKMDDKEE